MKNIDETIKNCTACGVFPKLKDNFIQLRKSNILVLGESPAKDGWLKSGRAFFNSNGELQASGKVLNKLLNMCSLSIDDINFTESCKCIIENRKRLRECINNCKPILFSQIGKSDFDIILPMGQFPTEAILGKKITKLKDYVGKIFEIKIGQYFRKVIPIYHTSPISPLSFKGNEPIFKEIIKPLVLNSNQNLR